MQGVSDHPFDYIDATLKKSVAAFREADVPALLGGSLAVWARGGPETHHDLDFVVKPADAERALQALEGAGMAAERPPEGWLLKARDGDVPGLFLFPSAPVHRFGRCFAVEATTAGGGLTWMIWASDGTPF